MSTSNIASLDAFQRNGLLPTAIAGLDHATDVFTERAIERLSSDYHELFELPQRMLRWGPDALFAFRYEDLRRLGTHPAVGNFPAEMFVKMGFTTMAGLPIPFEEAGNILRFQKNQFFTAEPGVHGAIKRIFTQPLMPKEMPTFKEMAESIADEIIDVVAGAGEINLVGDFAGPLAMRFWGEVFQMTTEEREGLANSMHKMGPLTAGLDHTEEGIRRLNDEAFPEYWRHLVPPIRRARASGKHIFLNRVAAQFAALPVELAGLPEDVDMFMACNMIDGFHAMAGGVACAINELLNNQEAYDAVRENPQLAGKVVAEALRLNPQVPMTSRYVYEDIELDGLSIPRGSRVSLYWASANRDPSVFHNPSVFDMHREKLPLTFGNGAQICPGRNIAQTMAVVAVNALVRRDISISLSGQGEWIAAGFAPSTSPVRIPVVITKH